MTGIGMRADIGVRLVIGFFVGLVFGILVGLNSADVQGEREDAERGALYDVTMDGYDLYLGCLKDDCRAERIAQKAVVQVAARNLCKRGVAEKCILEKSDDQ